FKYCSGSAPSITYTWSPSVGLSSTSIANPIATPTSNTTYKVVATDNTSSCTFADSVKILVGPNFTLTAPASVSLCGSSGIGISVTPGSPGTYTYSWTPSSTLSAGNVSSPTANPSFTTNYYVKVSSSLGCIKTDSVKVLVPPISGINLNLHNDSLCIGQSVQLNTSLSL